jgi:acyl-CoA thioesterase
MVIDDYLLQAQSDEAISIHSSWGQGRTTFGGLSAALLAHKMQTSASDSRTIRSLNINFCGALLTDQPFTLSTSTLSDGKSISQFNGQVTQNDKVTTQVVACLANDRKSDIIVTPQVRDLGEPGKGMCLGYIKGLTPEFVQHVSFSYTQGKFPFSGTKETSLAGWVRFNETPKALTEAHIIALVDAWPPTLLPMVKNPCPCATVSWNIEFIQPLPSLKADEWIYYESSIESAGLGYGHTNARIYSEKGELIALSRQLVAVYDQR